jgi:hypothetical protein
VVATADDMATTGSLLRPQPLTVSVERIAGTATGGCVTAGKPIVELHPAPQLRVPIAPTQQALLPGLPRAEGCLLLVFSTTQASTVFRQAAGPLCSLPAKAKHTHSPQLHQDQLRSRSEFYDASRRISTKVLETYAAHVVVTGCM